jgi:hypothetical protein
LIFVGRAAHSLTVVVSFAAPGQSNCSERQIVEREFRPQRAKGSQEYPSCRGLYTTCIQDPRHHREKPG